MSSETTNTISTQTDKSYLDTYHWPSKWFYRDYADKCDCIGIIVFHKDDKMGEEGNEYYGVKPIILRIDLN